MPVTHRKPGTKKSQAKTVPAVKGAPSTKSWTSNMDWLRRQPVWIILAVASGTCAAINGVFAKLTTTALTSTFASSIASLFGLAEDNTYVNLALRGTFFGLNIVFNIAMWALFTAALTRSSSTTRVSIVNVSSNFFITAILGAIIFSEKLPLLWWVGAALLAAGNVVIGRREEGEKPGGTIGLDQTQGGAEEAENLLVDDGADDLLELRDSIDSSRSR
ncbi:hypothetical protein LTS08_003085 [Lithohypha guttulata]|nr:hypothetical protein LTS08_003085 [Lithohypha guttulata]